MAVVKAGKVDVLVCGHVEREPGEIGADRQFVAAAVDQHRQPDRGRAAIVEQFVHRRAHRAPAVQHVVDQQDVAAFQIERQVGRLHLRVQADARKIVAVERDVEHAERQGAVQQRMQALGHPHAAGMDADDDGVGRERGRDGVGQPRNQRVDVRQ